MTFMGSLEAKKGPWGVWTDLVYADFGADKSGSRDFTIDHGQIPVGVGANLGLDVKSWIWTLGGVYSLADKPEGTADLVFGARLLDMEQTLTWSINGTIPGCRATRARHGDGQHQPMGRDRRRQGRLKLGKDSNWFIPYYLDVGTGQSKFTWQGIAGVGYQFGWGSVIAAWRYLDYDFKSGQGGAEPEPERGRDRGAVQLLTGQVGRASARSAGGTGGARRPPPRRRAPPAAALPLRPLRRSPSAAAPPCAIVTCSSSSRLPRCTAIGARVCGSSAATALSSCAVWRPACWLP